jgi:hypothetical protein
MAKFGTEAQYSIWEDKKTIALQYQKDATRAYLTYLEVQKLANTLERRAIECTQGAEALNAVFHLFDKYYRLYIAACNEVNACIGKYGLVDAIYMSTFDFHSLTL